MFLLWLLFTVVKGCETKICSSGDDTCVWVVVRQRGRFLFWEDWGMTVFFQMDVHAPPSAQTESSASILWNTQCRRTAKAGINWEEVFIDDQLGCCCCYWNCCCCCCCLTQPHDAVGWSRKSSCLPVRVSVGLAQSVYFSPSLTQYELPGRGIKDRPRQHTLSSLFTFGCALCLLDTLSAALAVLLHGIWFLLHVTMSSASCFLPFIFIYLLF